MTKNQTIYNYYGLRSFKSYLHCAKTCLYMYVLLSIAGLFKKERVAAHPKLLLEYFLFRCDLQLKFLMTSTYNNGYNQ